jgi:hypothetical protein
VIEEFVEWIMQIVEGNESEKEIGEKLQEVERCKLKSLKRP